MGKDIANDKYLDFALFLDIISNAGYSAQKLVEKKSLVILVSEAAVRYQS